MLIKLYEDNTNIKQVREVSDCLKNNGLVIYPTDTIYAIGCSIDNQKGVARIMQIKGRDTEMADLSLICHDLSMLSLYAKPLSNPVFKLMKKNLPGPFTFILEANSNVPKLFKNKKKTIGIRVPDNNIIREIAKELGMAIIGTSIHDKDDIIEYTTDPELIYERFENDVNIVIDGGFGSNIPSTVVDCTSGEPIIVRQGKGELTY